MNVKEVSAKWFEVTITYDSVTGNGETKKVAEVVTINAMSFAEAETKALEEYACIATGDTDSLQLVSENVTVRIAKTKMGKPEAVIYDINRVKNESIKLVRKLFRLLFL